jgi:ABC-2 type transport system ATP-binding protein
MERSKEGGIVAAVWIVVGARSGWRMRPAKAVGRLSLGLLIGAASLSACSSSPAATNAAQTNAASTSWVKPTCNRPVASPVAATPVPGTPSDWTITSFDGTPIRAHWFPVTGATASHPAPVVLMGPGWGQSGDTDQTGTQGASFGGVDIGALHDAGYSVLTWDPRGFGASGGSAEVDSSNAEARDVSRLIDWVATRPGVQLDAPGDPRLGMVGASYGGGIQWVTAAQDCRVDAIVPIISWNSLLTSLYKTGIAKAGWAGLLIAGARTAHLDPTIRDSYSVAVADGATNATDQAWFGGRGPKQILGDVHVPTLVVQGTVDTLFTLDEGVANYDAMRANGVPVAMLWFCGGHGLCLTKEGDPKAVETAAIAWLDRWVERDSTVDTGPAVDLIDQNGVRYAATRYPLPTNNLLAGEGSGTLPLVATGGAGPATVPPGSPATSNPIASAIAPILPARAATAVDVAIRPSLHTSLVVGAPVVTFTYRGTTAPGTRPSRVFAQIVDDSTGQAVGNQVTPVVVDLDGNQHTTSVSLETIAESVAPGHSLMLQLVPTTVAYATPQLGGSITFSRITVSLPVARPSAVTVTTAP